MNYKWKIQGKANNLIDVLRYIAKERNFSKDEMKEFISTCQPLHDPMKFKNMKHVVERIKKAIANNELICIIGDYDCDGVTSTYVLYMGLKYLGANVIYKLPHRLINGYGLKNPLVDYAKEKGAALIITVDNGIAAVDAVKYAKDNGIDVIVTDHHDPQEVLPDCLIINPKVNTEYPFNGLCGCGVAFKVVSALVDNFEQTELYDSLIEITAIGTVADAMDLVDENRFIIIEGLKRLQNTSNVGLLELFKLGQLEGKTIDVGTLGFFIGPNINACGRVDSPDIALNMLLADDIVEANKYAKKTIQLNDKRKELQKNALDNLEINEEDKCIIGVINGSYAGIGGIVASNVVDLYHKPCFIFHGNGEIISGSGRTFGDFEIINCVLQNKHIVEGGGGHKGACGVSLKLSRLEEFRTACNELFSEWLENNPQGLTPTLHSTCEMDIEFANMRLIKNIDRLKPFGSGNPEPIFTTRGLNVFSSKIVGKNENVIQFKFSKGFASVSAVGFKNIKDKYIELGSPKEVDIMYTIGINEWPAKTYNVQLTLIDIIPTQVGYL